MERDELVAMAAAEVQARHKSFGCDGLDPVSTDDGQTIGCGACNQVLLSWGGV